MLPFHISRLLGFKSKTYGYALINAKGIRLIFRDVAEIKKDPDEDARSLEIPWSNLVRMEADRGLIADKLRLYVHQMEGEDPDGRNDNVIELQLEKQHRDELERFERYAQQYQSGQRKDDVDDVLDDVRDLLDRM